MHCLMIIIVLLGSVGTQKMYCADVSSPADGGEQSIVSAQVSSQGLNQVKKRSDRVAIINHLKRRYREELQNEGLGRKKLRGAILNARPTIEARLRKLTPQEEQSIVATERVASARELDIHPGPVVRKQSQSDISAWLCSDQLD